MNVSSVRLLVGHAPDVLRTLPDASVHCAVTSPPYFRLRDYGLPPQVWGGDPACAHEWTDATTVDSRHIDHGGPSEKQESNVGSLRGGVRPADECLRCGAWRGELGQEPTVGDYVDHLVSVLREVRRVLRDDGTLWLNLGDSYAGSWGAQGYRVSKPGGDPSWHGSSIRNHPKRGSRIGSIRQTGIKPKDLIGVPWRVAFALQADGWYLRSDVVWAKPNPMPESVTDRPTRAHEYLFLLAKSPRYFYDAEAIAEPVVESSIRRVEQPSFWDQRDGPKDYGPDSNRSARGTLESFAVRIRADNRKPFAPGQVDSCGDGHDRGGGKERTNAVREPWPRNARTVWTIPPAQFRGAHFATFPEELVRRAVLTGTSERGVCPTCGAPWRRILTKESIGRTRKIGEGIDSEVGTKGRAGGAILETIGWESTCRCDASEPVPAVVLDPFGGSGTAAKVAATLGRSAVSIDLNPEYADMQERRVEPGLLVSVGREDVA